LATGGARAQALEALVLAGGFGSRFGGGKLTASWQGGLLIEGALATAMAAPARTVTVVTGADPKVAGAVAAFFAACGEARRLRLVHAADHAEGMAATLRAGVASLPDDTEGAFVFLGDMPLIPPAVLADLAAAVAAGAPAAAPVFDGQRGHPVLFGAALFPGLMKLAGDEGARQVLKGLGDALVLVAAPDRGVLIDIDSPDDLE
jgi:molybdenum cofactor cytidylyltransferase